MSTPEQLPEPEPLSKQDLIDIANAPTAEESETRVYGFLASFTSQLSTSSREEALKMLRLDPEEAYERLEKLRSESIKQVRGVGDRALSLAGMLDPRRIFHRD